MEILFLRVRLFFEDRWMDTCHVIKWLTSAQYRNYWRVHKITQAIWKLKEKLDDTQI